MKIIKEIIPYVIIIVIVMLIRSFIMTPVIVDGKSMEPNLENGEVLLLSKITYKVSDIKRFDVVVINEENEFIIKRVIGLPGDYVEYKDNKLYVNGNYIEEEYLRKTTHDFNLEDICDCDVIPEGKYLVLGDNRTISKDSRMLGLIDKSDIKGKAIVRIWPLNKINIIK